MKTNKLINIIASFLLGLTILSCNDKEVDNTPKITILELGIANSGVVTAGEDLHVEVDVVAELKIDYITLEIHREGEHDKGILHEEEWEYDSSYTGFLGKKNTLFHEHIDIPSDAEAGDYHFHFEVTDMDGNESVAEAELEIN